MKGEIKMKDRIKELWDKSKSSGVHPTFGEYDMYSAEKFAELIILECAEVAFNDWCDGTNEGSSQMAILKHFGVE